MNLKTFQWKDEQSRRNTQLGEDRETVSNMVTEEVEFGDSFMVEKRKEKSK